MSLFSKQNIFKATIIALVCLITMPTYGMMSKLRMAAGSFQKGVSTHASALHNMPQATRAQITVAAGCATAAAGCFAAHTVAIPKGTSVPSVTRNFGASKDSFLQTDKKEKRMSMEVRQLTPAEWPIWKAMYLAAIEENPVYFGCDYTEAARKFDFEWEQQCSSMNSLKDGIQDMVFCASYEGKDIGVLAFRTWNIPGSGFCCHCGIATLYVTPKYRCQGVAKKLINAVITRSKNWKLEYVQCEVHYTNENAIKLWDSYGFKTTGSISRKYWIKKLPLSREAYMNIFSA